MSFMMITFFKKIGSQEDIEISFTSLSAAHVYIHFIVHTLRVPNDRIKVAG